MEDSVFSPRDTIATQQDFDTAQAVANARRAMARNQATTADIQLVRDYDAAMKASAQAYLRRKG